jgi:hypothetical protein
MASDYEELKLRLYLSRIKPPRDLANLTVAKMAVRATGDHRCPAIAG